MLEEGVKAQLDIGNQIVERIKEILSQLPDNPKLFRNGNSFTISSSDLEGRLDPFYYDYKAQYAMIITLLKSDLEATQSILRRIIETRYAVIGGNRYPFHPDVLGRLEDVL